MDISHLTPEQLSALKSQLDALANTGGRSSQFSKGVLPSNPRQLMDLRKLPKADDPRPTFFWSTEESRDGLAEQPPYRRLMWAPDGTEITVYSEEEQTARLASGYVLIAPANAESPDPQESMRAMLAALSAEDRKLILASAQRKRRARLEEQLAELSDAEADALLAQLEPVKQKRSA